MEGSLPLVCMHLGCIPCVRGTAGVILPRNLCDIVHTCAAWKMVVEKERVLIPSFPVLLFASATSVPKKTAFVEI